MSVYKNSEGNKNTFPGNTGVFLVKTFGYPLL